MDSADIRIRAARASEAQTLSQLAICSKAFWGYSDEQMGVFSAELTMSAAVLQARIAYVASSIPGRTIPLFCFDLV